MPVGQETGRQKRNRRISRRSRKVIHHHGASQPISRSKNKSYKGHRGGKPPSLERRPSLFATLGMMVHSRMLSSSWPAKYGRKRLKEGAMRLRFLHALRISQSRHSPRYLVPAHLATQYIRDPKRKFLKPIDTWLLA